MQGAGDVNSEHSGSAPWTSHSNGRDSHQQTTKSKYEQKKTEVQVLWRYWKWSEVAQLCPTLCHPMDCSLPGSSIPGILQAEKLEWVTISFSSTSSQPRDQTQVSHIAARHFTIWATREAHC